VVESAAEVFFVAEKAEQDRWRARPVIATLLRVVIVGVPLGVGYLATLVCLRLLRSQIEGSRWWLVLVAAVSVIACVGVQRMTRRLLPLAALLKLSMLFPDRAPSRFKIARRALSVERLAERAPKDSSPNASASAGQALALITALTAHDRRTRGHSERVRLFTDLLGEQLRLPREARDKLRWSSLLHDIGKLQVAVDILNKPAKLNNVEWDLVAAHPATGEQLLGPLIEWLGEWGGAVRQHHEKFDGTGYPDGVAGGDICRAARIVSIADSYEVMTAHRAYKKPMATVAARAELTRCAGTQFDPTYVRAFLEISLPRLLWAMGPGSLLMNIPLLRALADTANKGALATTQTGVLTASAAAVISGVSATAAGHAPPQPHTLVHLAAAPRHSATVPATSSPTHSIATAPSKQPAGPIPEPIAVISHPPTVTPRPASTQSTPSPAPSSTPTSPPPASPVPPPIPPVAAAAGVAFAWVPFPMIASTTASVGFTPSVSAAAVRCSLDNGPESICSGTSVAYSNLGDGHHVIALTPFNNQGQPGSTIRTGFTVDTQSATVTWTSTPPALTASHAVALGFATNDPSAATWCSLDGAAASVCHSPLSLHGLVDGPHAVSVYTIDPLGNVGPAIQTAFTVDTTSPTVTVTSAPPTTITTRSATLNFAVDDPWATAWCSLDGATAATCSGTVTYPGLVDGPHNIAVFAVDTLGNVGPTVHTTFTVDTTAPVVTLTSTPAGIVPSHSVSLSFSVDDPNATTWCALDGGAASQCSSPVTYTSLPDGPHTVSVYAIDAAGNTGATIQTSFTVSATAPTVTLTSVPPSVSNSPTASVAFTVDDPAATAFCSLDGNAPTACTSPISYTGLSDGPHTINVYATSLGNQQSSTASTSFTIDTVAPTVTITHAPAPDSTSANATLSYSIDDPTASAWCSIDGSPAAACTSPVDLSSLAEGPHTVSIYAVDPAGNTSAAVQASFTIDNTAPTVSFTSTPTSSASRSATASFTTNDTTATTWCTLDNNTAQTCAGGTITYANLTDGSHTISVYATDQAGNRSTPITTSFTVAAAAPTLLTTPPAKSSTKTVTFTWIANPGMTYQYSYDGLTWSSTTTLISYSAKLKGGTYTFHLRGLDTHSVATAETTFTFQVT
jgi:HD-GYP domain-containing protein (c-di-GMP phosphodiesterase class II)